jgi:hypothetical protein
MSGQVRRVLAVAALLIGGAVGMGWAAKALPCADFISSGGGDGPLSGWLVGTSTMTYTYSFGGSVEPGGIGISGGTVVSESFEVGFYEMSDGRRLRIDCRNYTLA